jgi:UDP-glucose-4-epimerase GalE
MTRHVLVTGGAGYIGSHTCKALAKAGFLPVTLDNLIYGHEWAVKWGPLVKGNIQDKTVLDDLFVTFHPVAVLHFAAYAYVGESITHPGKYYDNNVVGTLALLEAMHKHGCRQLVFSSTCATYGVPEMLPITEETPQKPINPYGKSKWMIEQILEDFQRAYGLEYIALRYFNAAGADPENEIGEDHDPEPHLLPLIIKSALDQKSHVEIYGTDYPTPDGTAIRDYIHVADLAEAHVFALDYLLNGGTSVALNLGTGMGYSVREMIQAVEKVGGVTVAAKEMPRRPGDPPSLVAEPSKAKKLLGWQARFPDVHDAVNTAWRWHQSRMK